MEQPPVRILIADDSHEDASFLREALGEHGVGPGSFVHVTDGESALSTLSSGREFDLAVIDYYLPKQTAFEIAQRLNERGHVFTFPVIVLSSYLPPARIRELAEVGIDNVMQKPSDWERYQGLAGLLVRIIGK